MNTKRIFSYLLFCVFSFCFSTVNAQTPVELHITHKLGGMNDLVFNQPSKNNLGNDFNVSRLEYYISKISIKHDGGMVTDVPNHYILANGSQNVVEPLGSFNITSVESISFYIGVDTPINHADPSLQPSGHPLAPKSPSMHWGWSSGYRFVAMEGNCGSSMNQVYEIHALGDQHYFKTTVNTTGVMKGGKLVIAIHGDYQQALKGIDISAGLIAHGDNAEEAKLLANFRDNVFSAGFPVSVASTMKSEGIYISPNPSVDGNVHLSFGASRLEAEVSVTDIQGRLVKHVHKNAQDRALDMYMEHPGLYFVKVLFADGSTTGSKLLIQ